MPFSKYTMVFIDIFFVKSDTIEPVLINLYNLHLSYRLIMAQKYYYFF